MIDILANRVSLELLPEYNGIFILENIFHKKKQNFPVNHMWHGGALLHKGGMDTSIFKWGSEFII